MFGVNLNEQLVNIVEFNFTKIDKALAFGGTMLLIGMATVFAVLSLLWICLTLFKVFFHDLPEKRAKKAAPVISETVSESNDKADVEGEIVAVIAAAIAMAESESDGIKFRVVSFRRK